MKIIPKNHSKRKLFQKIIPNKNYKPTQGKNKENIAMVNKMAKIKI